jgi:hypothetical protein
LLQHDVQQAARDLMPGLFAQFPRQTRKTATVADTHEIGRPRCFFDAIKFERRKIAVRTLVVKR